jgi:hypothetical protein
MGGGDRNGREHRSADQQQAAAADPVAHRPHGDHEAGDQYPSQSAVVRVRGGQPVVTDGPYLEAKEYLGGFYLIDCENKERATELAALIPDAKVEGMAVEVRPVMFSDGQLEM